jgi:hypothetical protein
MRYTTAALMLMAPTIYGRLFNRQQQSNVMQPFEMTTQYRSAFLLTAIPLAMLPLNLAAA